MTQGITEVLSPQQQLLIDSGTNWNVVKKPLVSLDGETTDVYGIFKDDGKFLSAVGSRYTPLQNSTLVDMLYTAAGENGVQIHRGGSLSNEKRVYYQIDLGETRVGGSGLKRFLTALNSHDGQTPIGFGSSSVVVVCRNTFFRALQQVNKTRHTPNSHEKLQLIVETMRIAIEKERELITSFQEMSGTAVPATINDDFLREILGITENTRSDNRLSLLKSAIPIEEATHGQTKWALFNAVTRFTNHLDKTKDLKRSIVEGSGFQINNRAYDLISVI
jgi:uridine phosphorylase